MSMEKRTRGYEVLIRINADGTIGAHYATISEFIENGVVIAASPPELTSLGSVEGADANLLQQILGDFSTTIVSANDHLTKTVLNLTERCNRLESDLAEEKTKTLLTENQLQSVQENLNSEIKALTDSRDILRKELLQFKASEDQQGSD